VIADRIRDGALRVLADDPHAGMGRIAAGAGVGRATLYRHYAGREELIDALRDDVRAEFRALVAQAELEEGDPVEALTRFVTGLWHLRERYAVITPPRDDTTERRAAMLWRPLHRLVVRAQESGDIAQDLPPAWVAASLRALVRAAAAEVDAGRLARRDAPALVVRQLLRGARP
jgi:TetR/AcrR family transcriptional repressor of mexCD-oprJ operon